MTNNPKKIKGLEAHGITVSERVPHLAEVSEANCRYLRSKKVKMGYLLHNVD